MKKDYRIGDRVLVSGVLIGTTIKGVIIENPFSDEVCLIIGKGSIFMVDYDDPYKSIERDVHLYSSLKLDVQYYREERLKKLLDKQ